MQDQQARRPLSLVLALLVALSLLAVAPLAAGADEPDGTPAAVAFDGVSGNVQAGRTVPVAFTVTDADGEPVTGADLDATHIGPEEDERSIDVRAQDNGRYKTRVRTTRADFGLHTVAVEFEGAELGALTFTAAPTQRDLRDLDAVTILHDTHFHGDFGDPDGANIARYMRLVEQRKRHNPGALFIGNGDDLAPSVLASVFRGEHMIEALNASPLDVNTLGNHEFDFGPDNVRERVAESDFPWVSANVRDADNPDQPFAHDLGVEFFIVEEVNGVELAITGLGPENMPEVTSLTQPGDDSAAEHILSVPAMQKVVPMMQASGADLVVVASHLCGPDARALAAEVDGIDVIVGDHCAEVLERPEVINDTIVSFAGDEFDLLAELTLWMQDGELVRHGFTLHEVTDRIAPDPTIQRIVDRWEAELDEALGEVIGERVNEWDVRSPDPVRSRETPFANYIVDTMAASVGAELALTNGGGIRSDQVYEPGPIIRRDIVAILPFFNTVVMVEVTGETILAALENGVSRVEAGDGRFPHVSGMAYVWDPGAEPDSRIVEVTVGEELLDPEATYSLATNNFLLGGGDGYTMLADGDVLIAPEEGRLMSEVITEQIIEDEVVEVFVDGRISTE
jgi:5'-nucleotidase / UDP-sugar diphosphatase